MASQEVLKQKEEEVKALAEKLKSAKIILLTDYRGINVADVTALRTSLRDAKAEYKVIKNNIIKRALDSNGETGLDSLLEGPTAIMMSEEDYKSLIESLYLAGIKGVYEDIEEAVNTPTSEFIKEPPWK